MDVRGGKWTVYIENYSKNFFVFMRQQRLDLRATSLPTDGRRLLDF